ncbi:MAG: helix-turn-helix domain-containing protein [Candidatus Gastranaerophilales bacterium]|nr:helix-turn-helix domain-containing protein [Candidatus Gastranaerophilales bacterium]
MDPKKILGKRIQYYRKIRKITQEKLAEIIGIDTISISKIETGKNYPTAENLEKIASVLKVELYELFVNDNIKTNEELLNEIHTLINTISKDNKKLHVLCAAAKSLV